MSKYKVYIINGYLDLKVDNGKLKLPFNIVIATDQTISLTQAHNIVCTLYYCVHAVINIIKLEQID